ncbi:major facilitator superfamily domain-containing protein [Xylariales sp. PMI_506]|nr:major facilitator superfamily domain-containing protein [Xylariales sp. PMI_506]
MFTSESQEKELTALHRETIPQTLKSSEFEEQADDTMQVDEKRTAEIRNELAESRQGGWRPISTLGRRVGAARFMGTTLFIWGALTIGHAFNKNNAQLLALRLLMGLAECGFYPSALAYPSLYAIFYGMASLAGAFGGLIAYGILQVKSSLWGWQYLFIIQGTIPMILGLILPFWLAQDVSTAWYLKPNERAFAQQRMVIDNVVNANKTRKVSVQDFKAAFTDWQIWTFMISNTLGLILMIVIPVDNVGGRYAGLMVLMFGTFMHGPGQYQASPNLPLPCTTAVATAWISGNMPDSGKRVVAFGISRWANVAGIIGSQLFLSKYGPSYVYPLRIVAGLLGVSSAGFITMSLTSQEAR